MNVASFSSPVTAANSSNESPAALQPSTPSVTGTVTLNAVLSTSSSSACNSDSEWVSKVNVQECAGGMIRKGSVTQQAAARNLSDGKFLMLSERNEITIRDRLHYKSLWSPVLQEPEYHC